VTVTKAAGNIETKREVQDDPSEPISFRNIWVREL
jgi:hypothetical protein